MRRGVIGQQERAGAGAATYHIITRTEGMWMWMWIGPTATCWLLPCVDDPAHTLRNEGKTCPAT